MCYGMPPDLKVVEQLLKAGADPDIKDEKGKRPDDWAREWRFQEVVDLIEKYRRRRGTKY